MCSGGICCLSPFRCWLSLARSPGRNGRAAGGRLSPLSVVVAFGVIVFAGVYWLNQYAVRSELEPRRQELETLLMSLKDETPDAN